MTVRPRHYLTNPVRDALTVFLAADRPLYVTEAADLVEVETGTLVMVLNRLEQLGILETWTEPADEATAARRIRPRRYCRLADGAAERIAEAYPRYQLPG